LRHYNTPRLPAYFGKSSNSLSDLRDVSRVSAVNLSELTSFVIVAEDEVSMAHHLAKSVFADLGDELS
jgi:hypothetical protein